MGSIYANCEIVGGNCRFGFQFNSCAIMERVIIELINSKAYKLLQDMEKLNLIRFVKKPGKLSGLRGKIKVKMSNAEIGKQLNKLRERGI